MIMRQQLLNQEFVARRCVVPEEMFHHKVGIAVAPQGAQPLPRTRRAGSAEVS